MARQIVFSSLNISATALSVQRRRMDVIAKNLANVSTTRTKEGGPYRREIVVTRENKLEGNFGSILNQLQVKLSRTRVDHLPGSMIRTNKNIVSGGVEIDQIARDSSPPKLVYDPQHPDADENGYVRMPNINVITEMVDLIGATRAYEANLTVVDATKNMVKKSLEI